MSTAAFILLLLCYLSSGISFKLQNILDANLGYVKVYDSIFIKLLQIISYFIMPLIILWGYYSWFSAILLHIVGLFLTGFISQMVAPSVIKTRYAHLIVIVGMVIGSIGAVVTGNRNYNDGYYCAEVRYYNPNTETKSKYHLTVQVEDNRVILLSFPNGGWLDEDHFDAPKLSGAGIATIIDDREYEFKVSLLEEGECKYSQKDYYKDENEIEEEEDEENATDEYNRREDSKDIYGTDDYSSSKNEDEDEDYNSDENDEEDN